MVRRHPAATHFAFACVVPALGFCALVLPGRLRGHAIRSTQALTPFPIMEVGVFAGGLLTTRVVDAAMACGPCGCVSGAGGSVRAKTGVLP